MLAKEKSNSIYSLIKDYTQNDVQRVVEVIRQVNENEQAPIVEAIGWVLNLLSDTNIERVIAEGIMQQEGETTGIFLCRVFIEHFNVFQKIADRAFGEFVFDKRSFTIFSPTRNISTLDNFTLTSTVMKEIETRCKGHFKDRNYSDYCEFIPGNYGSKYGLIIDRGSRENGAAKIKSGKTVFNPDRYKKSDILFIDKETGLLWISVQNVNKTDLYFYKDMASEIMIGQSDVFKILNFNFSILTSNSLLTLGEKSFGRIEKVLLREVRYKPEIGKSHKGSFTTTREHHDCLTNYPDFINERMHISQFSFAKFHLHLEGNVKDEIIIKRHSISTGNQVKESDIGKFLNKLGLMPTGHCDA